MLQVVVAAFALYLAATLWLGRRALATREPEARLRAARRLLAVVSLGAPLLAALILVAW